MRRGAREDPRRTPAAIPGAPLPHRAAPGPSPRPHPRVGGLLPARGPGPRVKMSAPEGQPHGELLEAQAGCQGALDSAGSRLERGGDLLPLPVPGPESQAPALSAAVTARMAHFYGTQVLPAVAPSLMRPGSEAGRGGARGIRGAVDRLDSESRLPLLGDGRGSGGDHNCHEGLDSAPGVTQQHRSELRMDAPTEMPAMSSSALTSS